MFDGKVCSKCGEFKPLTRYRLHTPRNAGKLRNDCMDCQAAYTKAWRESHPGHQERKNEQQRRLIALHPERREKKNARSRIQRREAYHADVEQARSKNKELMRQWRRKNPELSRAYSAVCRARKRFPIDAPFFTADEWIALCRKYNYQCVCCRRELGLSPDHVVPVTKGGTNTIDNIQPLCVYCNMGKGVSDRDYRIEWELSE